MLQLIVGVEENIQEVVGHITEGVCRPLKVKYSVFMYIIWYLVKLCPYSYEFKHTDNSLN